MMERAVAVLALCVFSPLLAVVAVAVWLADGRPIFFTQERSGSQAQIFRIVKFRTMKVASTHFGQVMVGTDSRVTRLGALLRASRLDELPQLINIARGEMVLVGPRPELPELAAMYPDLYAAALCGRPPGITSLVSLALVDEASILNEQADPAHFYAEHLLPAKLIYESTMNYASRRSRLEVLFYTLVRRERWSKVSRARTQILTKAAG